MFREALQEVHVRQLRQKNDSMHSVPKQADL